MVKSGLALSQLRMRKKEIIDLEGNGCNHTELSYLRAPRGFCCLWTNTGYGKWGAERYQADLELTVVLIPRQLEVGAGTVVRMTPGLYWQRGCCTGSSACTAKHRHVWKVPSASWCWLPRESSGRSRAKSTGKWTEVILRKTSFLPPTLWDSDPRLSGRGGILEQWLSCESCAVSGSWNQCSVSSAIFKNGIE